MIDPVEYSRKQYDPQLDEDNRPAEDAVEAYLKRQPGIYAVVRFPFGRMDVDLAYEREDDKFLWVAEVECRKKWWPEQDVEFTWIPIRIPLRKYRLALRYKAGLRYFGVRADLRRAYTFTGDAILAGAPVKIGPHNLGDEDEGFIELSKDALVEYVDLV